MSENFNMNEETGVVTVITEVDASEVSKAGGGR